MGKRPDRLFAYRDAAVRGLTMAEAARQLGVSGPAVSKAAKLHGILFAAPRVGRRSAQHGSLRLLPATALDTKSAPEVAASSAPNALLCKPGQFRLGDPARLLGAAPSRDRLHAHKHGGAPR